ncbi:hypothetical protein Q3C01_38980 [Bradyrhizobium sp. UFLA05-109]
MATIALQAAHLPPRPPQAQRASEPTTALQPLDPEIISASIPAFFIGRNTAGLWVAREASGRVGGIFLFKSSAVEFAHRQSKPAQCALVFPSETFELDVENDGNPFAAQLARWTSQARRRLARLAA